MLVASDPPTLWVQDSIQILLLCSLHARQIQSRLHWLTFVIMMQALVQRLSTKGLFGLTHWLIRCMVARDENSFVQELSYNIVDVTVS